MTRGAQLFSSTTPSSLMQAQLTQAPTLITRRDLGLAESESQYPHEKKEALGPHNLDLDLVYLVSSPRSVPAPSSQERL